MSSPNNDDDAGESAAAETLRQALLSDDALEQPAEAEAQAPVHSAPQESDAGGQRGSDERQKSASEANTTEECEAAD